MSAYILIGFDFDKTVHRRISLLHSIKHKWNTKVLGFILWGCGTRVCGSMGKKVMYIFQINFFFPEEYTSFLPAFMMERLLTLVWSINGGETLASKFTVTVYFYLFKKNWNLS